MVTSTPMCPGCKVTIPLAAVISAALMKYGYDIGNTLLVATPIITATVFYGLTWYYQKYTTQNVFQQIIQNPADDCDYIGYIFNITKSDISKPDICDVNSIESLVEIVSHINHDSTVDYHSEHCAG